MPDYKFTNNATTTLSGALTSGATSLTVASAATFPAAGDFTIIIDSEIMLVTGVAGTTFTVTRAQEGTSAAAHDSGATVTHVLTANWLNGVVTDTGAAPKGVIGEVIRTSNQGSIGASEVDLTGLAVTVNIPTADRRVKISAGGLFNATAAERAELRIKEGATIFQYGRTDVDTGLAESIHIEVLLNPTAGAHTFNLAAISATGAGFLTLNAGADHPAYLIVEDVGQA